MLGGQVGDNFWPVFFNDRRRHGLFAARRTPDGSVGKRCKPEGKRDDGSSCSLNWLGAQYMVVDVIELDEGFFAPTAWDCKKEEKIGSVAVAYDGSFEITVSTDDPCNSDKFSSTRVQLRVRTRFCGSDWCFSIRNDKGDPYELNHPTLLTLHDGDEKAVSRLNFFPAGTNAASASDTAIAANYYASIVDSILMLHRDGDIPFYKSEFGEIEFHYPSTKSSTATARSPDEVVISTFESREPFDKNVPLVLKAKWIDGRIPAHEYGHILMQRAWDGDYGFKGVGISANDSKKAVSQQIAFKEAWAEFISRAVFEQTRGCGRSSFDDNGRTLPTGPLGEGAQWRINVTKALCDWYDTRDDNDTSLAGPGDYFAAEDIKSMWSNLRNMYTSASEYGGEYKNPGLWFCDYVKYYLDVRKSTAKVGASSHASYETKVRDLIYNNNIGCFMTAP